MVNYFAKQRHLSRFRSINHRKIVSLCFIRTKVPSAQRARQIEQLFSQEYVFLIRSAIPVSRSACTYYHCVYCGGNSTSFENRTRKAISRAVFKPDVVLTSVTRHRAMMFRPVFVSRRNPSCEIR